MKSMTGFGKAVKKVKDLQYSVEIRSINSRFSEVSFYSQVRRPSIEHKVTETVRKHIQRGKVDVALKVESHGAKGQGIFNEAEIRQKIGELEKIRKRLKLKDPVDLELLAEINRSWFFKEREEFQIDEKAVAQVTEAAVANLVKDRQREGKFLQKVLTERLALIKKTLKKVHARAAKAAPLRFEKLQERVIKLLDPQADRPAKLEVELALIADKSDVTEELDRLAAHLEQMEKLLSSTEPVGRQLDFLLQEINREVNTIGSKSQDATMSADVILVKGELEKIREQIQNLE